MGGSQHKKKGIRAKKKQYKKGLCTKRRPKDIDQIQVRLTSGHLGLLVGATVNVTSACPVYDGNRMS